ncbi:MAG: O-antigen ligase family protein, partial [Elusimicrobiota bacterium]
MPAYALSQRLASRLLLACLFGGFLFGGLRSQLAGGAVLLAVWLVALLGPARPGWELLRPWLMFLGWSGLALLASASPLTGLYSWARWAGLAAFLVLASDIWDEYDRGLWFWGLGIFGAIAAAASWLVPVSGYPWVGILPPYYNYTAFVQAALFCAALAAALRRDGPHGPARKAVWLLAGLALVQIFVCKSRGGLLAAACGSGVFAWRHLDRRYRKWTLAVLALALAAALALATLGKMEVASAFKRPQIWRAALAIAGDNPIFGAGPGRFGSAFLAHNFSAGYGLINFGARAEHAHSEFMEVLAETGWPGLLLLLAALWSSLRAPRPEDSSWTREAALAAFCAMTAQCLVDNMLHMGTLGLLYFSALAVARGPRIDMGESPHWKAWAWAGLVLALLAPLPGRLLEHWDGLRAGSADPAVRLEASEQAVRLAPSD